MSALHRFSRTESATFFAYATAETRTARTPATSPTMKNKRTSELEIPEAPEAPMKPVKSAKTNCLMSRWKARSVVRNLLPELCDPHNPEYWEAVDAAEDMLRGK